MSAGSTAYMANMRTQVDRSVLWSDIKWGAWPLAIAVWGLGLLYGGGPGTGAVGVLMVMGAAIGVFFLIRRARRRRSPAGHPLNLELTDCGDMAAIVQDISNDFAARRFVPRRAQVAHRWLCYAGKGQVTVRPLNSLVWAYDERISHRLNQIIPYRPASHQIMLWERSGRGTAIPVRRRDVMPTLAAIHNAAPWTFIGYNETLNETWNSDRREFIALTEARRQQARAGRA